MDIRDALRAGDKRAAARLITMLENGDAQGLEILASFADIPVRARVIGITGAPGSGKSTLTDQLAKQQVRAGRQVGIIAVDPSSPVTGGAFLGDRVRMSDLNAMPEVFIRSMATRGALGGLAKATAAAVRVLELFGADVIFVETVGTGQSEVDVARLADTVVLVMTPGMGDDIQTEKAGILELTDIIAVNKADLEGADRTIRHLLSMRMQGGAQVTHDKATAGEGIRIVPTVATSGAGIDELTEAIEGRQPRPGFLDEFYLRRSQ